MNTAEMTTAELRIAIDEIFAERGTKAGQSQYDRGVCIRAVAAARHVFEDVPVEGTATKYGQAVVCALSPLYENYNDPDGEYTSGKGVIGDVFGDISSLLRR